MKIIQVNTDVANRFDIDLGLQGENLARTLEFDVSGWRAEYGDGTVQLLHKRSFDKDPYPAAIEQDGDVVRWPITAADTAMAGTGRLQLLYFVGETLVKQMCRKTFVGKSLGQPGEIPEAQKPWVEQVLTEAAKVTGMTATAVELPAGSDPTAEYVDGVLTIGIPVGGDVSEAQIAQAVSDYLASHPIEETDPNVYDWAKQPKKPTYTAEEVGALSAKTLPDAINTALAQAKESGAFDGADGKDGAPGADGGYYTPSVTQPDENTMRVSFAPSDSGMTAVQAVDVVLPTGPAGTDGTTPTIGDNGNWYLGDVDTGKPSRGEPGQDGSPGAAGSDGYTPVKGTDYFTDADKQEIAEAAAGMVSIPDKLPNPNALTFTGAVTGSYDGSEAVTVEIPSGGGGVDEEYEVINTITITEPVNYVQIDKDMNGNQFSLRKFAIFSPCDVKSSENSQLIIRINSDPYSSVGVSLSSTNNSIKTSNTSIWAEFEVFGSYIRELLCTSTYDISGVMIPLNGVRLNGNYSGEPINTITIMAQSSVTLTQGTFIILGVRK